MLAICGIIWALCGIGGWLLALGSLFFVETGTELLQSFALIALLTSGFFIWSGWVFHSFKQRFLFVTQQTFWSISLVHHLLLVLYLIPVDVWGGGDDPWLIPLWTVANVLIAAFVLTRRPWKRMEIE